MPYTLGIPVRQQRRANQVLRHSKSEPIEFEATKQDKDFYIFSFEVDYDDFQEIVIHLKQNGVTTIGADEQLTERKIMKLTDLLKENEEFNPMESADDIIAALEKILELWETKEYASDKERYEHYYLDIEDLVTDYKENQSIDMPDTDIQEEKLRKLIRKMLQE